MTAFSSFKANQIMSLPRNTRFVGLNKLALGGMQTILLAVDRIVPNLCRFYLEQNSGTPQSTCRLKIIHTKLISV